jgi:hypothetical protein
MLNQINNTIFTPTENESFIDARMYYVLENEKDGEIFSVLAFGGGDTILVNGNEVEHSPVLYEFVIPFLPEDAVETIERYLDNMEQEAAK